MQQVVLTIHLRRKGLPSHSAKLPHLRSLVLCTHKRMNEYEHSINRSICGRLIDMWSIDQYVIDWSICGRLIDWSMCGRYKIENQMINYCERRAPDSRYINPGICPNTYSLPPEHRLPRHHDKCLASDCRPLCEHRQICCNWGNWVVPWLWRAAVI